MNVQLMNTYKPNQDQLQTTESIRNACEIFNVISLLFAYHSTMIGEVCPLQMVAICKKVLTYLAAIIPVLAN